VLSSHPREAQKELLRLVADVFLKTNVVYFFWIILKGGLG